MEKFRYSKEWEDKCRQWIWRKKTCYKCLFEMRCLFDQNQEKILYQNNKKDDKNKDSMWGIH